MKMQTTLTEKLAAITLTGSALIFTPAAEAISTYYSSSDFTITLTSFSNVRSPTAALGVELFVTSSGLVDYDHVSSTGTATLGNSPVFNGPAGNWALGDSFSQGLSTSGSAGDVIGSASSDIATVGTIQLASYAESPTTFYFDWSLNLNAEVTQDGITPQEDFAESLAEFSISFTPGMTCSSTFPLTSVSASTFSPGLNGSHVINGSFSCINAGTHSINIFEHATGNALALYDITSVPLPAAGWMLFSGLAGLSVIARRRHKTVALE